MKYRTRVGEVCSARVLKHHSHLKLKRDVIKRYKELKIQKLDFIFFLFHLHPFLLQRPEAWLVGKSLKFPQEFRDEKKLEKFVHIAIINH